MLYVLITFDYELYFGKNYENSQKVLFEPTKRIADILGMENTKSTFFTDVCSVIRHRELCLDEYVNEFSTQICELYESGHDIQLHIHPHWLKSHYKNGEWIFAKELYTLEQCGYDSDTSNNAYDTIDQCIACLNGIIRPKHLEYRCVAYRAGGYSLEPYNHLFPYLRRLGVMIDSSIAMYAKSMPGSVQRYDYTKLPEKLNWWIDPEKRIYDLSACSKTPNAVFELPIAYYQKSITDRLILGKKNMSFYRGKANGTGIVGNTSLYPNKKSLYKKIMEYNRTYQKLSLDTMNFSLIMTALNRIYKKYNADITDAFISVIGHPKSFGGDAFENMRRFVKCIKAESKKYRLISIMDLYNYLNVKSI